MMRLAMYELIDTLSRNHAMEILIGLGLVQVLIDYFFRTDVPAHIGYFCFALAFFFALGVSLGASALLALGFWVLLEVLHHFVFSRFLTNAPGKERPG